MFINLMTIGNGGGSTVPSGVTELVVVNDLTDVEKYNEIFNSLVQGVDLPQIYVYKGYHKDIYFTNAEVTTRAKGSGTATATGVLFSCVDVVSEVTTRFSYFIFQDGAQLFKLGLYEDKAETYEPVVFSYSGLTDVSSGTTLLCSATDLQSRLKSGTTIGGIIKFTNEVGAGFTYKGSYPCSISVHHPDEGEANFPIHVNFVASDGNNSSVFDYQLKASGTTTISGASYGKWMAQVVKKVLLPGYEGPTVISVATLPDSATTEVTGTFSGSVLNTQYVVKVGYNTYSVLYYGEESGILLLNDKRLHVEWKFTDITSRKVTLFWRGEENYGLTIDNLNNYYPYTDGQTTKYYKSTPRNSILYYFNTKDAQNTLVTASTFYSAGAKDGFSTGTTQYILYVGRTTNYADLLKIYFTKEKPSQVTVAVKYSGSTEYQNIQTLSDTDENGQNISFKIGKTTGDTISFYYSHVDNEYKIWQDTASTEMVWFMAQGGMQTTYSPKTYVLEKGYYPQLSWANVNNVGNSSYLDFTLSYNVNNTPWTKPFVRWERNGKSYYLRVNGRYLYMAEDGVEETVATGGTSILSFYISGDYAFIRVTRPADSSVFCAEWTTSEIQNNAPVFPYGSIITPDEGLPKWDFTGKIIGKSDTVAVTSDSSVSKIVALTQAEYDALETKDATTVYIING